jgi:hypothetical protein
LPREILRATFNSDKFQNYGTTKKFRSRLSLKHTSASFTTEQQHLSRHLLAMWYNESHSGIRSETFSIDSPPRCHNCQGSRNKTAGKKEIQRSQTDRRDGFPHMSYRRDIPLLIECSDKCSRMRNPRGDAKEKERFATLVFNLKPSTEKWTGKAFILSTESDGYSFEAFCTSRFSLEIHRHF